MISSSLLVAACGFLQDATTPPSVDPPPASAPSEGERILDSLDDPLADGAERRRLPVTLEQCVQLAERNSLLLRVDEIDVQIAKGEVGRELGRFDTIYFLSTSYSRNHDPVARVVTTPGVLQPDGTFSQGSSRIEIEPIVSEDWRVDTGFRGTLVSGATYSVDLAYTKSETERPDPGPTSLDPTYRTDVGASISQPLLRGAGTTVTKASLLSARNTLRGAAHALEESRIQRAAETIAAYWNYYFARRNLETRELLVEQSSQLVEINKKKKAVGTMITLDVLEAQSELAQRQQELIVAKNEIERSADALKRLIFEFDDRTMWEVELVPLTDASAQFDAPPEWNEAARVALEQRPELARRREFLKNNDIAIVVAENSVLPRLDFDASLRFNQLAGSKGQALNYDDDLYTLAVGFTLEVPIGNRSARADRDIARLQKLQALIEYKDAENQVIQDVRDGVREVLNSQKEIEAAHEAVRLASQRFAQLIERRGVGNATTFDVREAQTSWREAIDSETRALFNYEVAKALLEASKGTLLERYGILASPMPRVDERVGVFSGS